MDTKTEFNTSISTTTDACDLCGCLRDNTSPQYTTKKFNQIIQQLHDTPEHLPIGVRQHPGAINLCGENDREKMKMLQEKYDALRTQLKETERDLEELERAYNIKSILLSCLSDGFDRLLTVSELRPTHLRKGAAGTPTGLGASAK
ncbi:uncharacterized protein BO96DRAFT_451547 [Aspergillus niger CBS 101883]|uniref:uncharacterized protein n=1 Tax=Aspergillus lacticoffeatus (strain CBS 101883) TaxID=1450533 RepID=UPI000D7F6CA2|nr:uncharacterized protein BO96DRAFT_451547 [Aspergillus niger CBS 101883]PYH50314.1 hypothetical protein BO96DRAFT_451547 [Aspergillus niger CBS 101883]